MSNMILEPLDRSYSKYWIRVHKGAFTKPTKNCLYIRQLQYINDNGPYVKKSLMRKAFPNGITNPYRFECLGWVDHYSDGRLTYWKITNAGKLLLEVVNNE